MWANVCRSLDKMISTILLGGIYGDYFKSLVAMGTYSQKLAFAFKSCSIISNNHVACFRERKCYKGLSDRVKSAERSRILTECIKKAATVMKRRY